VEIIFLFIAINDFLCYNHKLVDNMPFSAIFPQFSFYSLSVILFTDE